MKPIVKHSKDTNKNIDFVTGKPKIHRQEVRFPHHLWAKLMKRKIDTGESIQRQIITILEQTLD